MRKITLLLSLVFLSIQADAQIAPGSVAPDFTVTDINGTVHSLSAYLAEGKTVIMDVSATWCAPCWGFHNSKALEDVYTAYGPEGSDEVVVLFVEGDAATTLSDLQGTGNNTQGNWVENTPYPIIDGSNIASLYQIGFFPTLFSICPDGIVSEIAVGSVSSIRNSINSNCGPLTGVQNNLVALENETSSCTTLGSPIVKVRNFGENIVTSATLNLKADGVVVATKEYAGTIIRFATKNIAFDEMTIDPNADYTVEVINANGAPVFSPELSTATMLLPVAPATPTEVVVKVYTDSYPAEISWAIKTSTGAVVATGGPYEGNADGSGGGADANTTKVHNVTLPVNECLTVQLLDSFGDGWSLGNTPHGIEIFANDVSIWNASVGDFGLSLNKTNALNTTALGVVQSETTAFGVYPNPTSGILHVNTLESVSVSVVDMLGKVVYNAANITKDSDINLSGLPKGIYVAKIISATATTTEKVILK